LPHRMNSPTSNCLEANLVKAQKDSLRNLHAEPERSDPGRRGFRVSEWISYGDQPIGKEVPKN
jgi:hypothetical protein